MRCRLLYADLLRSLDVSATEAELLMAEAFTGPDFTEGVAAMAEKRAPRFADADAVVDTDAEVGA